MFNERVSTGNAKAAFNQATLNIGLRTVDDFYKVLAKHEFPAFAF